MTNQAAQAAVVGAAVSLEKIKGDIVTQTLDKINSPGSGGTSGKAKNAQSAMSDTYNFSKSVLSSVYEGKGTIIDSTK